MRQSLLYPCRCLPLSRGVTFVLVGDRPALLSDLLDKCGTVLKMTCKLIVITGLYYDEDERNVFLALKTAFKRNQMIIYKIRGLSSFDSKIDLPCT